MNQDVNSSRRLDPNKSEERIKLKIGKFDINFKKTNVFVKWNKKLPWDNNDN